MVDLCFWWSYCQHFWRELLSLRRSCCVKFRNVHWLKKIEITLMGSMVDVDVYKGHRRSSFWDAKWLKCLLALGCDHSGASRHFWLEALSFAVRRPSRSFPTRHWSWPRRSASAESAQGPSWTPALRTVCALWKRHAGTYHRSPRWLDGGFPWTLLRRWPSTPQHGLESPPPVGRWSKTLGAQADNSEIFRSPSLAASV